MLGSYLEHLRSTSPLIHNITNYVTANDCANITLACGASPIMAEDLGEVEEITSLCKALVINIGTLKEHNIPAMLASGKKANELNLPVILDPVGIGASQFRTATVNKLLREIHFTVIRGNKSEIKKIYQCFLKEHPEEDIINHEKREDTGILDRDIQRGVDASMSDQISEDTLEDTITLAETLSRIAGSVIVITGAIDIVTDERKTYIIRNGHPMMSRITGSGCMLTSLLGAFCGANTPYYTEACASAVCMMGIGGELAHAKVKERGEGTAAFRSYLIDAISLMNGEELKQKARAELLERVETFRTMKLI